MNDAGSWLDDGLIRRVQCSLREKVLCAEKPIAAHQGFHNYNRLEHWTKSGRQYPGEELSNCEKY